VVCKTAVFSPINLQPPDSEMDHRAHWKPRNDNL
jgi:hypothetical protein